MSRFTPKEEPENVGPPAGGVKRRLPGLTGLLTTPYDNRAGRAAETHQAWGGEQLAFCPPVKVAAVMELVAAKAVGQFAPPVETAHCCAETEKTEELLGHAPGEAAAADFQPLC